MTGLQQLQPDTLFAGDYRVLRPLAEGNMGAVYLVQQLSTSKHRALKLMQPELLKNSDARRRFELEAKIGSQIDSDHVVDVVHAGVDSQTGIPWLAMEFLEGQDLASYVATTGPLSVPFSSISSDS